LVSLVLDARMVAVGMVHVEPVMFAIATKVSLVATAVTVIVQLDLHGQ
jgi:hypothetical protein